MKLKVTKVCCNPKFIVRPGLKDVSEEVAKALFEREAAEPTEYEGRELQAKVRAHRAALEAKEQAKVDAEAKSAADAKLAAEAKALHQVIQESAALAPSETAAKAPAAPRGK